MKPNSVILNHSTLSREAPHPWTGRRVVHLFLLVVLSSAIVVSVGCGGGSSGTGESNPRSDGSVGQIVDVSCNPIPNIDMSELGLQTAQTLSGEDGSFVLVDSKEPQQIPGPPENPVLELETRTGNCIVIVLDKGEVVSTQVYPSADLPECSIEGLEAVVREEDLPPCGDRRGR